MRYLEKSLWSIRFSSNSQGFGSGVIILDENQVVGGDHGYYYIGNCTFSDSTITASVTITRHNLGVTSIFGNLESVNLSLSGTIHGEQIQLSGNVKEYPQMTVQATMCKLKTLD